MGASQARQFEIISNSFIISPNLWKYRYFRCFSLFRGQPKHRCKKPFQNIVSHNVFTMFPFKNRMIYMFFAIKSVQNRSFQCSDIQKPFNISLLTTFFHFWMFLHCRQPAKMTQTCIKIYQHDPKWSYFCICVSPEKLSHRWCFCIFVDALGTKKHRKYQCFRHLGNPKPRYLQGFLHRGAKITVFAMFFGPDLAKTLVFT